MAAEWQQLWRCTPEMTRHGVSPSPMPNPPNFPEPRTREQALILAEELAVGLDVSTVEICKASALDERGGGRGILTVAAGLAESCAGR